MDVPSWNHVIVRGILEQAPRWLGSLNDGRPRLTFLVTVLDDKPDPAVPDMAPSILRIPVVAPWHLSEEVTALQVGEYVLVTGALQHLHFPAADGSVPPTLVVLAQKVNPLLPTPALSGSRN